MRNEKHNWGRWPIIKWAVPCTDMRTNRYERSLLGFHSRVHTALYALFTSSWILLHFCCIHFPVDPLFRRKWNLHCENELLIARIVSNKLPTIKNKSEQILYLDLEIVLQMSYFIHIVLWKSHFFLFFFVFQWTKKN